MGCIVMHYPMEQRRLQLPRSEGSILQGSLHRLNWACARLQNEGTPAVGSVSHWICKIMLYDNGLSG